MVGHRAPDAAPTCVGRADFRGARTEATRDAAIAGAATAFAGVKAGTKAAADLWQSGAVRTQSARTAPCARAGVCFAQLSARPFSIAPGTARDPPAAGTGRASAPARCSAESTIRALRLCSRASH